uniref:RM53 protein n=1 Tax=Anolis carolinensis TaxID=28377 RepID=A0A803STZ3_ANOCA
SQNFLQEISLQCLHYIKHDGSEPVIDVTFADGDRLIMKGANLTTREMLQAFNSRCTAKELVLQEKSQKKANK